MGNKRQGCLYVVATPIGNLGDMIPRAVDTLQSVDAIVAEDTRHSKKLLQHFSIGTPIQAFHDHSSSREAEAVIQRLLAGESIALISDAGTPLISDPGFPLVHLAHQHNIAVVPIPGACAAIAALSASGLPADRFWFEGFLSAKKGARQQRLTELKSLEATVILYEAPHRIIALYEDLLDIYGAERACSVGRELTKQFETIRSGTIAEIKDFIEGDSNQQRGELVVMIAPLEKQKVSELGAELDTESERVLDILLDDGLSVKQASVLAAKIIGKPKRLFYEAALRKKEE